MYNCILDGFPEDYMGYPLNTDFKVGILLNELIKDDNIEDDLKLLQAFNILYKETVPEDVNTAYDGLVWFLSCGKSELYYEDDYIDEKLPDKCLDFGLDHLDIWGAFWAHGVDLRNTSMHWFAFMSAIGNLGDCPLTQKIAYRSTDLTKLKGDTKKYYSELKNKFKVRKVITKQEYEKKIKDMESKYGSYYMKIRQIQG